LTTVTDRYRPSFGRLERVQHRQCCFIGTTNRDTYLRDETGGRRFWPVKVRKIDVDALKRDRDQLFAEAARLYRGGTQWWPTKDFERTVIAPEQDDRFETDAWEENVEKYLTGKTRVTVSQVAREAIGLSTERIGTADQRRVAAVMEHLRWKPGKRTMDGRWWVPGHDT
jgi:predicted P-loop ATPase